MYLMGMQLLVVPRKEIESGCCSKIFIIQATAAHDEHGPGHDIHVMIIYWMQSTDIKDSSLQLNQVHDFAGGFAM